MIIKLTYQEKCACSRSSFCTYVENEESFTSSEKEYLVKVIVNDNLSGVLYVSTVLVVWSLVVGVIDVILFPGIIVYAVFHGVIDYKVLTPPIVFMIVNFSSKLIYIGSVLKGRVSLVDIFVAALPYAGSAYLLKKFLVNDKLLSQAMVLYLKEKKKQVKKFFLDRFRLLK
ncbi:hypothetical protein BZG02_04600 [Labilibaculum filiforme]|uniref:Uncharacterized protein n=1 Tax=Labilibaculum filiforme TaxID=1940526 RepID=A0A2N3I480_9BACT|nr:hypothetical protein [Labilibaculum filiforme]PKQ65115.1 hypothetical protein BZG02_04600 [Labilibaculum filiforme]